MKYVSYLEASINKEFCKFQRKGIDFIEGMINNIFDNALKYSEGFLEDYRMTEKQLFTIFFYKF